MDEITPLVDSSQSGHLMHEKKPKLPKTQTLKKKRNIKTLQKKNDQEGHPGNNAKKRKLERKKSKCLVHEAQGAKHVVRQARKKTKATQTENRIVLNDALFRYIDAIVYSKMKKAMAYPPIYIKYEEPLVQFANYGHEPVTGRLYAWDDVADLPKPFDPYWMLVLGNMSPSDDNSFLRLSLASGMDLSTIAKETELYSKPIVNHSSGHRRCDWIYEILSYLSLFGMIFAVLDHFHDMLNSEQPVSILEWSFSELGNFLRTYLYIDMYNIN
ncbi:uncharacterized protein LOC26527271 isoform X2 [Drosophila mojavensis]|uniref:Uncharacterized protein n=1 Tax=Drosophila mojavensis TaxID=7230 RepID=A0A0Q9XJD7_DROMO|nr:uncharacterized protein LOC26527271 isoform X2 [Drosophila mojavensis]KRG03763.1 uncharacterized protein Dmoj_GI25630 [Drosophila mojavensis]